MNRHPVTNPVAVEYRAAFRWAVGLPRSGRRLMVEIGGRSSKAQPAWSVWTSQSVGKRFGFAQLSRRVYIAWDLRSDK